MLIAIGGSQGSGKSTILKEIKELGFNTIERKTSRSILKDWGVTLQQVNTDPDLTLRFQTEITERKYNDEQNAIKSSDIWFTERTHTDLFAYALGTLGKYNEHSDWLNRYYDECMRYNQEYSLVFYLRAGQFDVKYDGVRGSNHHYSRMIDLTMLDLTQQMIHNSLLTVIETPNLNQRVSIITAQSLNLIG